MDEIERILTLLDFIFDSPRRKHIVGGMLLSISLLFGGLAFTTMTIKEDKENDDE